MKRSRVLMVFGTRPEAIKMAPLYHALKNYPDKIEAAVCLTAQHREMLDQVTAFFNIEAKYDLDLMKPDQTLHSLTAAIIERMKPMLEDFKPDYVLVHGDTTTSMSAALAAFYSGCKIGHVEAGLRTHNKWSPFPEEMNRSVTGRLADIHFSPTPEAKRNLLHEGIPVERIMVTGNTVIDALHFGLQLIENDEPAAISALKGRLPLQRNMVLVTGHRRENFGDGFLNICHALKEIAERANVEIVYPVHLNPHVQQPVYDILSVVPNIHLIQPQPYESFIWLMNRAKLIITDSGGVQEEAPSLGKPVLLMRDTTERPEAVSAGTVLMVGTVKDKIVSEALDLLLNDERYTRMSQLHNPYGDGKAAERIAAYIAGVKKDEFVFA